MCDDYGLGELHEKLLSALDALDEICRGNHIRYSLHGGTLLGAVRNGKLIPWDDDVDVSMTRADYKAFKQACLSAGEKYSVDETDSWVPKFIFEDESGAVYYIDIFIWDYISEKKAAQKAKILLLHVLQGMLKKDVRFDRYSLKNKLLVFATHLAGLPFPYRTKLRWYQAACERCLTGEKRFIHRGNDNFASLYYIYDAGFTDAYTQMPLETGEYMAFTRYEEILIKSYGEDYMTPPQAEGRQPNHETRREYFARKGHSDQNNGLTEL